MLFVRLGVLDMKVQSVQSSRVSRQNFGALFIAKRGVWEPETLKRFVQNKEIQKFVKYFHDKGIDVNAVGTGKIGIALWLVNKNTDYCYPITGEDPVGKFNAEKAIKEIADEIKMKLDFESARDEVQKFVEKFNKAL